MTPTPQPLRIDRLHLTDFGAGSCPRHRRAKPASAVKRKDKIENPLLLGEVRDGIERRFCHGEDEASLRRRLADGKLTEPECEQVVSAVGRFAPLPDGMEMDDRPLVFQHETPGSRHIREIVPWGLTIFGDDRRLARLVLLRNSEQSMPLDDSRIAAAAKCAAAGKPAHKPSQGDWYTASYRVESSSTVVTRVEIVEYLLDSGDSRTRFEGTAAEALDYYKRVGRPAGVRAMDSTAARPGYDCDHCALASTCDTLPSVPGLLGVEAPGTPRATWSATNGRNHHQCPRKDHLQRQKVSGAAPSDRERVGRAVDAALNLRHREGKPCNTMELPSTVGEWQALGDVRTPEEASAAAGMLAWHTAMSCPFIEQDTAESQPQASVIAFDPTANVIVRAMPDLLYTDDGGLVWRETKTTSRLSRCGVDPLQSWWKIQVATAVLLLGSGAAGASPPFRYELELLTEDGGDVLPIDATDPAEIERARAVVATVVRPWRDDPRDHSTRPGDHCRFCDFRERCEDAVGGEDA